LRFSRAYKHARDSSTDLVLRVEGVWIRTEAQINVVLDLLSAGGDYQQRLLRFHEECLDRLETKLHLVLGKLQKYIGIDLADEIDALDFKVDSSVVKRIKFAFFEKHLQGLVADLTAWHADFDPSWLLLTRLSSKEIDTTLKEIHKSDSQQQRQAATTIQEIRTLVGTARLKSSPTRPELSVLLADVVSDQDAVLTGSSLSTAKVVESGQNVVLDMSEYPDEANPASTFSTVGEVAQMLSISEVSSLGFLKCLGVIKLNQQRYQYVLGFPTAAKPQLLRQLLASEAPSLDARFQIARLLARTVMSLHTADFVHKNIRPETIVVWPDASGEMNQPFLVGFGLLRPHGSYSALIADMVWHRNLYRHPERQGLRPQEVYIMQHDIYSLGVCLLEIGLWASFVLHSGTEPEPSTSLNIGSELRSDNKKQAATHIKQKLIDKARRELPSKMGKTYTSVVLSCLTCLDKGAANTFEDQNVLWDKDGIIVGVAFIEKILMKLGDMKL
jgi:serine/threonine protein kinase